METPGKNLNSEEPTELFIDVSSPEILESLSAKEKELVNKYRGLFQKLNENTKNERPGIVSQHARDGDIDYNEGNKLRQIVDRLKEENS